jgi:hypothetical protein
MRQVPTNKNFTKNYFTWIISTKYKFSNIKRVELKDHRIGMKRTYIFDSRKNEDHSRSLRIEHVEGQALVFSNLRFKGIPMIF